MSEYHQPRSIDRWLKWIAILGPFIGFLFGIPTGAVATYSALKENNRRLTLIESWKDRQDDFNRTTVIAIAQLQEVCKRIK